MHYIVKWFFSLIFLSMIIFLFSKFFETKISELRADEYLKLSNSTKTHLQTLIDAKAKDTLSIALILGDYDKVKRLLLDGNISNLDLNAISLKLRKHTNYKNVWIQVIDKNGISLSRSWVDIKNDNLISIREDIKDMIKNPIIKNTISVGKFDLSYKAMVPVFDEGIFLGFIEVITHFNSIVEEMKKDNFSMVVLTDKRYKKQLIYPFTGKFIDDYYVANKNTIDSDLVFIQKEGIEKFIYIDKYEIIDKYFVTNLTLLDDGGEPLAYFIALRNFDEIDYTIMNHFVNDMKLFVILISLLFAVIVYLLYGKRKERVKQSLYYKEILDSSSDILIVTDSIKAIYVNANFFEYFKHYKNFDEFTKDTVCICNLFINKEGFIQKKMGDLSWIDYIITNQNLYHKVMIKIDSQDIIFNIRARELNSKLSSDDNRYVVVLTDITDIENYKNSLEQLVKEKIEEIRAKDNLLIQNAKMIAMGEMIGAISHQWKQPLNMLSLLIEELEDSVYYDGLKLEFINHYITKSTNQIMFMAKTIDDFRNFLKPNKKKEYFKLKKSILEVLDILDKHLNKNSIELNLNVSEDIELYTYKGELQQVLLNLVNNSKDALLDSKKSKMVIDIQVEELDENRVKIAIIDNASGIPIDIQDKIFKLYFTTKSEKNGTGMGLYLCKMIVEDSLMGRIYFKSEEKTAFYIELKKRFEN